MALQVNYALGPIHHALVLGWSNMLTVQVGDDNCVGNGCSDIKAELMKRGRRLQERLIIRERECSPASEKETTLPARSWHLLIGDHS